MIDLIHVIFFVFFVFLIFCSIFHRKIEKFFARFGIKVPPPEFGPIGKSSSSYHTEMSGSNSSNVEYTRYNPASGLPMSGGAIDIAGNLYGSSSNR